MANDSAWHKEQERKSNDIIRVYNPTDQDYVIEWDRANGTKLFRVPAKQEVPLVRYIANRYVKQMYHKILREKTQQAIIDENESRVNKGMAEMGKNVKSGEQLKFETTFVNEIQNKEGAQLISTLWVGVEQEFGIDSGPIAGAEPEMADNRSLFQKTLEDIQDRRVGEIKQTENPPESSTSKHACDYPGCGFTTDTPVALIGHKRSHRDKKEEAVKGVSQED